MLLPATMSITAGKTYTHSEVSKHAVVDDCWLIVGSTEKRVYDVSQFMEEHPGGKDIILEYAGKDASEAFEVCAESMT